MAQPNVVVIMADQLKATASHLYGNTFCETPSMARLAEEGVLFEHAFTPHPLCVPARVSLWTGQYPHSHGARRNETLMPPDAVHAFQIWKGAGYSDILKALPRSERSTANVRPVRRVEVVVWDRIVADEQEEPPRRLYA